MKNANNNEMERALHSLAKSERDRSALGVGASIWNSTEISGDHLDADELNSYAEGLVPEVARLRFTEHLADCTLCRGILVGLTEALGTPRLVPETESLRGPGFLAKVSAFFAMPVLRYGLPVLVLTSVIAIGLLALRQSRSTDFVAQHQPEATAPLAPGQSGGVQPGQQPLANTGGVTNSAEPRHSPTPQVVSNTNSRLDSEQAAKALATSDPVVAAPALKDSVNPPPPPMATAPASRTQPTFSEAPKEGTLASKTEVSDEAKKGDDRKQESLSRVAQDRSREADKLDAQKAADEDNRAFRNDSPSGPRRSEGRVGGLSKSKRDSANEEETRSIGGRRFRRQGSLWVDTDYEFSRATINVKRGSEQFRALVADEPGIRSIANSLSGEFIVVWKGKAYRIG